MRKCLLCVDELQKLETSLIFDVKILRTTSFIDETRNREKHITLI